MPIVAGHRMEISLICIASQEFPDRIAILWPTKPIPDRKCDPLILLHALREAISQNLRGFSA